MNLVGSSVSFEHEVPGADILCFFHGLIASDLLSAKRTFPSFVGVLQTKRDACQCDCLRNLVTNGRRCDPKCSRNTAWNVNASILRMLRCGRRCKNMVGIPPTLNTWKIHDDEGGGGDDFWKGTVPESFLQRIHRFNFQVQMQGLEKTEWIRAVFIARKQVTWTWGLKPWPGFQVNEVDRWVGE